MSTSAPAPPPPGGPPPPPAANPAGGGGASDGRTKVIQVAGGVAVGLAIFTLLYKYFYTNKYTTEVVAPVSTEKEPVPEGPTWPCPSSKSLEPCPEKKKRFNFNEDGINRLRKLLDNIRFER